MASVESFIDIAAPQADLFALAQDYALRLEWDPFLAAMKFEGGATEAAVGVGVWVKAKSGLTMDVEYTSLHAPDSVATKMTRGPWFFNSFAGAWRFKAIGAQLTRVTFRYSFTVQPAALSFLIEPLVRRIFQHDIIKRLEGLKRSAETTDIPERMRDEKRRNDHRENTYN